MFHNSKPVPCVTITRGLELFKLWTEHYNAPILIAHNAQFDARLLITNYQDRAIDFPRIGGFADSLKLLRSAFPGLHSYKQESLVKHILQKSYDAHNAVADVSALVELLEKVPEFEQKLNIISKDSVSLRLKLLANENRYLGSYIHLTQRKIMSKIAAKTLAGSGLTADHVKLSFTRNGIDGLNALLKSRLKRYKPLSESLVKLYES